MAKPVERSELWLRVLNLLRLKSFGDFLRNYNATLEEQVQARTIDLQRFRSAMDATADGLFLISRTSLEFLEVNATACTLLGCSRDELFEQGPAILGEASAAACSAMYEELIASGRQKSVELQLTRKDGSAVEIELLYHTRQIVSDWIILAVARDITERKQAQQRLCMVKERYPEAIRMILSGYADLQSVTDAVNQGAVYKFMNKPWDDEQLILNLEEAFSHKRLTDLNSRLGKERDAARSELALVRQQLQARLPPQAVPLLSAVTHP